jgi:hypothetical protein
MLEADGALGGFTVEAGGARGCVGSGWSAGGFTVEAGGARGCVGSGWSAGGDFGMGAGTHGACVIFGGVRWLYV